MYTLNVVILFITLFQSVIHISCDGLENLKKERVVGDVIDEVPPYELQVEYCNVEVNFGNELTPQETRSEPTIDWPKEDGAMYTIVMVDPDAPSRQKPTAAQWLHWLVVNVRQQTNSQRRLFVDNSGDVIAEYNGPAPPKGSGLHRYVLLVFKQSKHLKTNELVNEVGHGRSKFNIRRVAKKFHLGNAIAANFFQAQNR